MAISRFDSDRFSDAQANGGRLPALPGGQPPCLASHADAVVCWMRRRASTAELHRFIFWIPSVAFLRDGIVYDGKSRLARQ